MNIWALTILLFTPGCFALWTNICQNGFNTENECCKLDTMDAEGVAVADAGMETHEYQLNFEKGSHNQALYDCVMQGLFDRSHIYQLLTLESRREHLCVMKWIEHTQTTFGPFWLGLRADTQDGTRNLFEWEHPLEPIGQGPFEGNITAFRPRLLDSQAGEMTYEAWNPTSPKGAGDCVYTAVGQANAYNGLWYDVSCGASYVSVCERYPLPVTPTTTTTSSFNNYGSN